MNARMQQWLPLIAALDRTMKDHAPGWTDHNEHDPGVTIVELFAYLGEGLQLYAPGPERGRATVSRIIRALEAYQQSQPGTVIDEQWCGVVRPRFFSGQMLTADDLREEQEYHREQHRRHLQTLHGFGVVNGLDVAIGADGSTIQIEPGYAFDGYGQEICLHHKATLTIPSNSLSPLFIVVQYAERLVRPVLVPSGDGTEPSGIEEGCKVLFSPVIGERGVAISRLVREEDAWRADASFTPTRLATAARRDR